VVGKFNSIRRSGERRSVNTNIDYKREMRRFNDFIDKLELIGNPMVGRKFTWYKPNETIKSRIDQILVSMEWLDKWLDNKQVVLSRSVSDHCALVLKHQPWIEVLYGSEV